MIVSRFLYQGTRPHVLQACENMGTNPDRVEQNTILRRLNDLLCQVVVHHNSGLPENIPPSMEACQAMLVEMEAGLVAARASFDEVAAACQPEPEPTPDAN